MKTLSRYTTPRQATTLEWAEEVMGAQPCNYYDYTDATQAEWREWLANSEVSEYTFLADNIATARYGLSQSIRKYNDGCVLSWTVSDMYEINGSE